MLLKKNLQFAPKHTLDKSNDDFKKLSTVQNLKDESFLVSYCVTDTVSQSEPKRAKMNQNESEWVKMSENVLKYFNMIQTESKWVKIDRNKSKWVRMSQN